MSKQLDESYVENVCLKDYWSCISEVRFKNGEMVMSEGWEGQKVEIDWIWS